MPRMYNIKWYILICINVYAFASIVIYAYILTSHMRKSIWRYSYICICEIFSLMTCEMLGRRHADDCAAGMYSMRRQAYVLFCFCLFFENFSMHSHIYIVYCFMQIFVLSTSWRYIHALMHCLACRFICNIKIIMYVIEKI